MIVPFPGTPPRTPRLDPAWYRAQRSIRWRRRWWSAKRWLAERPELVAFCGVFALWLVLMIVGLW